MRKFFAILFSIFLVFPMLLAAQTATSAATWALDRQFYIDTLDNPGVYTTLTSSLVIDNLLRDQLGLPPEADTSQMVLLLESFLTPDYLREQVSRFVNDTFDHLEGKSDQFAPTLDIRPIKDAITGSEQDAFLTALVSALPPCAPGQIPAIGINGQTACKPQDVSDELLIDQVLKPMLPAALSAIPDEIPLGEEFLNWQESSRWRMFLPGMAVPASIILSLILLVIISVSLWYITGLISDQSWRSRLQWLGWTLLVPSILVFLLGFASQSGIPAFWIRHGLDRANLANTPFGPGLTDTLQLIAVSALPRVSTAFQAVGGINGAFSICLIFWGIALPRKKPDQI